MTFEYAALFLPPDRLAQIIALVQTGQITDGVAKRVFHLVFDIRRNWLEDVVFKEEDSYIWYLASQLAWRFNFTPNWKQEVSCAVPDIPAEIRRIHNKQDIEDFCKLIAQQEPKFYELYRQGKKGPLVGRILRSSCNRIEARDLPEVF